LNCFALFLLNFAVDTHAMRGRPVYAYGRGKRMKAIRKLKT